MFLSYYPLIYLALEEPAFVECYTDADAQGVFVQERVHLSACTHILCGQADERARSGYRQAESERHAVFFGGIYSIYFIIWFRIVCTYSIFNYRKVASSKWVGLIPQVKMLSL